MPAWQVRETFQGLLPEAWLDCEGQGTDIWTSKCIGAVLVHKGCIQEARDIFAQVSGDKGIVVLWIVFFSGTKSHFWLLWRVAEYGSYLCWAEAVYPSFTDVREMSQECWSPASCASAGHISYVLPVPGPSSSSSSPHSRCQSCQLGSAWGGPRATPTSRTWPRPPWPPFVLSLLHLEDFPVTLRRWHSSVQSVEGS